MQLISLQSISPESIREGFITDEEPLNAPTLAEGYLRLQRHNAELDGYATLFKEIPTYPSPSQGREILQREGFKHVHTRSQKEVWYDGQGIGATLQVAGEQAVITFEFQTLWATCPFLFSGSRRPFNLANGDVILAYQIAAEPGVLQMLRMARPYALRSWRVSPWKCTNLGIITGLNSNLKPLQEFKPSIPADENLSLRELMELSGETPDYLGETEARTTEISLRYWFKPFQGALCFNVPRKEDAKPWLNWYMQLAEYAHAQGYRLTERNAMELPLTGKLCCGNKQHPYMKVQLYRGKPAIFEYCQPIPPEIPKQGA